MEKLKKPKTEKESQPTADKPRVPFDELPNKIKKRIEKRNAKREQLKAQRKLKINMD